MTEIHAFMLPPAFCMYNGVVIISQDGNRIHFGLTRPEDTHLRIRLFHAFSSYLRDEKSPLEPKITFTLLSRQQFLRYVSYLYGQNPGCIRFPITGANRTQEEKYRKSLGALNPSACRFRILPFSTGLRAISPLSLFHRTMIKKKAKKDRFPTSSYGNNKIGAVLKTAETAESTPPDLERYATLVGKTGKIDKAAADGLSERNAQEHVTKRKILAFFKNIRKDVLNVRHFLCCLLLFLIFPSCKTLLERNCPYVIGEVSVEYGESPGKYRFAGVLFTFYNTEPKTVSEFTVSLRLYDDNGENPFIGANQIIAVNKENIGARSVSDIAINLDDFISDVPEEPYRIDFLYVSEIKYSDGSVWQDKYGVYAF